MHEARSFSPEQQQSFLEGVIEKIEVYPVANTTKHENFMFLKLPLVGDELRYKNEGKKSEGYDVIEGENRLSAVLERRRAGRKKIDSKKKQKSNTPEPT